MFTTPKRSYAIEDLSELIEARQRYGTLLAAPRQPIDSCRLRQSAGQ